MANSVGSSGGLTTALEDNDKARRKRVAEVALAKRSAKRTFKTVGAVVLTGVGAT